MPTFTAITLDRLLEPKSQSVKPPIYITKKKIPEPEMERKAAVYHPKAAASPLLYTTPESTPLPDDAPISYAPSPFIVNHKRRGPRLLKSFSQDDVPAVLEAAQEVEKKMETENGKIVELRGEEEVDKKVEVKEEEEEEQSDDFFMSVAVSSGRDYVEDDFFDPQDRLSVSSSSVEVEDSSIKQLAASEFYDACEELCSDSGSQSTIRDFENELREIRLNLLMEIERRRKAEESLDNMRQQWERLREQLSLIGMTLPPASAIEAVDGKLDFDPAEDLCQQVSLARAISVSIGRGCAKAEAEKEMESQIELKDFEISRLSDRLHYYEAMNHEMSQRNQEATEIARRNRQRRKQRQKWIWSGVGAAITLGSAALAWSYLPSDNGSAPTSCSDALERDAAPQP